MQQTERADPQDGRAKDTGPDAENRQAAPRTFEWSIVVLSAVSVTVYFASSNGVRNHIAFLADAVQKVARTLGYLS